MVKIDSLRAEVHRTGFMDRASHLWVGFMYPILGGHKVQSACHLDQLQSTGGLDGSIGLPTHIQSGE